MQSCCWEKYNANRDKELKLKGFKGPKFQQQQEQQPEQKQQKDRKQQQQKEQVEKGREQKQSLEQINVKTNNSLRTKLWRLFDDAYSSNSARVRLFKTMY